MKAFKRSERVSSALARELAVILRNDVKDPRVTHLTVTEARLSDDLSIARIFFDVGLGDRAQIEARWQEAKKGLESASGFIRHELGRVLDLRRVPELVFVLDHTAQDAGRIEALLKKTGEKKAS